MDEQGSLQATSTPAIATSMNVATGVVVQDDGLNIKEEGADADLDIGPTVLQHTFHSAAHYSHIQPDVTIIKQESSIKDNNVNAKLCGEVKEEIIEDVRRADTDDQRSDKAEQSEKQALSELYSCDECVRTYSSKYTLMAHCRNVHSTESHECTKCNKKFPSKVYLYSHTIDAHSEQQYECAVCKKICRSKKALNRHVYKVHRPRPAADTDDQQRAQSQVYSCDKCEKTYASKDSLMEHNKNLHSTESHECTKCNKEFPSKSYLYNHTIDAHSEQQYECAVCKKICRSKAARTRHVYKVHRPRPAADTDDQRGNAVAQSEQQALSQLCSCDKCGKTYTCKVSLLQHYRNLHSTETHKCTKCNKEFPSKVYLYSHTIDAHSEQQYECAVCKKISRSKAALNRHVTYVHGGPSGSHQLHSCTNCGKNFKSKLYCQQHEKRGTCTRPTASNTSVAASTSIQQPNVVIVKEEPVDMELELGPTVFQHMDCNYRPYKQEPGLD